jgi:hypothetical protein
MRKEDVDRIITQMIVSKECAERGCMAYDDRVDGPGEWIRTEWVGLTDEEKLHLEIMGGKSDVMLAEAIEAKLKEKNTVRMRRATRDEKIRNPGVYWVEDKE